MSVFDEPSELTPLRRVNLRQQQSPSTDHSEQQQQQQSHQLPDSTASSHRSTAAAAAVNQQSTNFSEFSEYISINNKNNNNNDHDIECGESSDNTNNSESSPINGRRMSDTSRILTRITIDFIIILAVGLPILAFYLWGDPYKRGFFCDDESLKHPFHDSTIRNWMLYIIGIVLPVGLISATEIIQAKLNKIPAKIKLKLFGYNVPTWIHNAYRQIGFFAFGAGCSQLATDIAKYSVGRFRPHFFDVCQPIMADGTNCSHPLNAGRYIEDFTCTGDWGNRTLKEVRLSFPSGHSSFSAYTMVYCAIYLQMHMTWRGSRLLKHFLQYILIMVTWFTSLSRISDYKHHWSDVLAGLALGTSVALIVANFVADLGYKRRQQPRYDVGTNGGNHGTVTA